MSGASACAIIRAPFHQGIHIDLGAHVILSTYGFWLPNDPRGSWSRYVGKPELYDLGRATKVTTRKSVAQVSHDSEARRAAKEKLQYPPVRFSGRQAMAIAQGFGQAIREGGYVVYACSILPTHVHLAIEPHERKYEMIALHLKNRATSALRGRGLDPMQQCAGSDGTIPSPWAKGLWKVYIHEVAHLRAVIRYVEENPLREGKRMQRWGFVTSFDARAGGAQPGARRSGAPDEPGG